MLTVACCLWRANERSPLFSAMYDESWVEKLYRQFCRHLTWPHRFVCFVDEERKFRESGVVQLPLVSARPLTYAAMIEPFKLAGPLMIVGLDTLILGNVNFLGYYCMSQRKMAAVRDPYRPERLINPVMLVPRGWQRVYLEWSGQNDMDWLRTFDMNYVDDMWPGAVISFKAHKVRDLGTQGASILYFHGTPKPHQLGEMRLIRETWI